MEVPGDHPELSYPRDRGLRFTNELLSQDGKIFKYRCDYDRHCLMHMPIGDAELLSGQWLREKNSVDALSSSW